VTQRATDPSGNGGATQSTSRRALATVALVALGSVLGVVALTSTSGEDAPATHPASSNEPSAAADAPRAVTPPPEPPVSANTASASARVNVEPPPEPNAEPNADECARDSDCNGPKVADCVRASCVSGKCLVDRSACECRSNDECDDGRDCTRDLCFSSTHKCIHIDDACKR
jgi:hypothetical protein